MFSNKEEKRFIIKEQQGIAFGSVSIIVDTKTGVNYLMSIGSGPSSLTPLLDENGNVVIDKN